MAVPTPRDDMRLRRRRTLARSVLVVLGLGVVVAPVVGPAELLPAAPANAAAVSSSLTVSWLNDTSSAKDDQPNRDPASPHYNEMKNIVVKVSQTEDIIDQAIRVEISGFAGTKYAGTPYPVILNGQNFFQAMQCWGADPNAADFVQTCQWGGRIPPVIGNSVYFDNNNRVAAVDYDPRNVTTFDNPFRTVSGQIVSGKAQLVNGTTFSPILSYFDAQSTNEVPAARIGSDGTGYFDFETQSSSQSPQLGCGTSGHLRCWLVLVPRGTKFGGNGAGCSDLLRLNGDYFAYGQTTPIQGGSPVNPKCDYFKNRIVVPLDFTPVSGACAPGSPEFRVSGSQFMISAMSSWQPSLCQTMSSTFSFTTNPDSVARAQLLDTRTGSPELIYSGYPLSSGELQTDEERTLLSKTSTQYAPVAISSVVVAYNAEFANGRPGSLNLTPRLMAKLLTQSYTYTVPSSTAYPTQSVAHLSAKARTYNYFNADPDFQQANPNWRSYDQANPSIVLPGPSGADGIKQVWRWILADKDAVDFLDGKADPWGMTINPYYLPRSATNAIPWYYDGQMNYASTPTAKVVGEVGIDGSPFSLSSTPLDTFPKDDGTLLPFETSQTNGTTRYDSIQFAPYAIDYLSAARQAFRGDPNSKVLWDATKLNDNNTLGAYVSIGVQDAGSRFMIAVTDSANAARYGLATAALTPPNKTTPVASTPATMQAALSALAPTTLDAVLQVNPANVGAGAYPLTMVTYAGVNLSKSTAASRETISKMLKQVTTTGQVAGTALGELPVGYLPLTAALQDQATVAAAAILAWKPPTTTTTTTTNSNSNSNSNNYNVSTGSGEESLVDPTEEVGADPQITTGVDELTDERTPASSSTPIERSGLAIALVVALLGFIAGPFILRRRPFGP